MTTNIFIQDILTNVEYFTDQDEEDAAIPAVWTPSPEESTKLVVVVGDNAGGKSLFRRIVCQRYRAEGIQAMDPSMEGRTAAAGINPLRSMIYGNESWKATGENSAHSVIMGVHTCKETNHPHAIIWDEPDLGLNEAWAEAMGRYIRDFCAELPEMAQGVYVITHSKPLLRELLHVPHHYLHLGKKEAPANLTDWLIKKPSRHLKLEQLKEESIKRFRKVTKVKETRRRISARSRN